MSGTHVPADLRRLVGERAGWQCEYCLAPDGLVFKAHQMDHTIAEKHGGATTPENLAMACLVCNNRKGTDLASLDPLDGQLVPLFNPRRLRWADHFRLHGGRIVPVTAIGRVTERLLQFNTPRRLSERELFLAAGYIRVPGV